MGFGIKTKAKKLLRLGKKISSKEAKSYYDVIKASGLFDEGYYTSVYGKGVPYKDALTHYIVTGAERFYNPSKYFSTGYYLVTNPDVRGSSVNPLYHYICYGEIEGRAPNAFFSPQIYLQSNADLSGYPKTLLSHFQQYGHKEGRIYSTGVRSSSSTAVDTPYSHWISRHESEKFNTIRNNIQAFKKTPIISIVVPVYNPNCEWLKECIESVMAQSYENWELCLADDKSTDSDVLKLLAEYESKDRRIKVVFRETNGHISEASNSGLEMATGQWIALLDHDDMLHEHALYHVVSVLNEQPEASFIYSDEDKMDEEGNRSDPHFKSSWNLDLLYSQNYISHLGVYQAKVLKEIGGFRKDYEGSQDYDLLLRYSREIDQSKIVHIPRVLYHWRMVEGSTALAAGEKSYTVNAGIKALKSHFKALGENVLVRQGMHDNTYKVDWKIEKEPLVSLIIPTYNGRDITKQAIESILEKSTYKNYEILLVDNNSDDPDSLAYFNEISKHKNVTLLRYPHPFNYSAINNFAAEQAKGSIIGLINNDIEVITPEWLTEMVSQVQRKDIGCVGAMLYYPDDTIQHAGVIIGLGGVAGHSHKYFPRKHPGYFARLRLVQNLSAVTAACLLVRKDVFEEVNGLNAQDLTIAFNDVDFCLKVQKAGYRNLWTPYAELYHYESISRGAEDNPEKVKRFNTEADYMKKTWQTNKKTDVFYNSNLTLAREDFSYER